MENTKGGGGKIYLPLLAPMAEKFLSRFWRLNFRTFSLSGTAEKFLLLHFRRFRSSSFGRSGTRRKMLLHFRRLRFAGLSH